MNRDRRAANYLLLIYGGLAVSFLSAPLSIPVQSFKICMSYLFNPLPYLGAQAQQRLSGVPAGIAHLISTDVENRKLREEVKRLALVQADMEAARRENERLKSELDLKPGVLRVSRWAHVMERDSLNWYRSIMIDVGRDEGIELNSPVFGLSSGTLAAVGAVTETGSRWSKVLLLSDEISSVAAYIPSKSWEGLIEGQGVGLLKMNYLSLQAQVAIGDQVFTSNTSITFPPDILIGAVSKILPRDIFLTFQAAGVTPAIDASTLQEVLILAPQKMGAPMKGGPARENKT